jgi:glucan 1,3-beta-glucosidase
MPYNVIEAFDQPWKRAQEGTVGGYWGIFDVQARPKFAMQGPVTEEPRWWLGWLAGAAGAALFVLAGGRQRRRRGHLALVLAGMASGCALAWQYRQMVYACRDGWEWAVSLAACALALLTALRLARRIAARLSGTAASAPPPRWLRAGWLFALAYYGLLLAVDGRYRDFPLGLFWLPCLGYALLGWLGERRAATMPSPEERFLALWPLPLALAVLVQEAGLTAVAWLWLGLNLLLVLPVLVEWCRGRRLAGLQTRPVGQ